MDRGDETPGQKKQMNEVRDNGEKKMEKSLLQRVRENRLAAQASLATYKEENIFHIADARQRREAAVACVQFTSRRVAAQTSATKPVLRLVA